MGESGTDLLCDITVQIHVTFRTYTYVGVFRFGSARLGVTALLVADHHEGYAVNGADARHHGRIVQSRPIAMQLHELVCDVQRNVQEGGPVRVPRHL